MIAILLNMEIAFGTRNCKDTPVQIKNQWRWKAITFANVGVTQEVIKEAVTVLYPTTIVMDSTSKESRLVG